MSPTPPTINPSETVERIREIIVGRHLERLEGRVSRLESASMESSVSPEPNTPIFEDRLLAAEAKVEALQNQFHRIDGTRKEAEQAAELQRQEAQQLASRIHRIAKESAEETAVHVVESLERKLGEWLTEWQKSMHVRLEARDQKLVTELRNELSGLKGEFDGRITNVESKFSADIEERFERFAAAARAFAESTASLSTRIPPNHE